MGVVLWRGGGGGNPGAVRAGGKTEGAAVEAWRVLEPKRVAAVV